MSHSYSFANRTLLCRFDAVKAHDQPTHGHIERSKWTRLLFLPVVHVHETLKRFVGGVDGGAGRTKEKNLR